MGQELSGVTFVRDYLQLQFNLAVMLNAFTPVTVRRGDTSATFGEDAFANLLLSQIGRLVRGVELRPEEALDMTFDDGSLISVSLRPEHYVGPEAINLFRRTKRRSSDEGVRWRAPMRRPQADLADAMTVRMPVVLSARLMPRRGPLLSYSWNGLPGCTHRSAESSSPA